jgi:hypothetical protein
MPNQEAKPRNCLEFAKLWHQNSTRVARQRGRLRPIIPNSEGGLLMSEKLKSFGTNILIVVFLLALGPGLFYYGASTLVSGPDSEVRCGGRIMHDGDVCRETRRGSPVGTKSYRAKRDEQNSFMNRVGWPVVALIFSSFVLLGSLFILRGIIKARRRGPGAPAGP